MWMIMVGGNKNNNAKVEANQKKKKIRKIWTFYKIKIVRIKIKNQPQQDVNDEVELNWIL